jgi:hypothetical protein
MKAAVRARRNWPAPDATPIAAFTQIVAAVVMPCTLRPLWMMAPAPRNPMPDTICAATRSVLPPDPPKVSDTSVKRAAPSVMRMFVRSPAGLRRSSRSIPTAAPSRAARTSRVTRSALVMVLVSPAIG